MDIIITTLKVLALLAGIFAVIIIINHLCRLNTWLNRVTGNLEYNPDIHENAETHESNSHFEDKDEVMATVNYYADNMDEVWIKSYDGLSLFANYLEGEKENLWVILVHGYTARNKAMFTIADQYYKKGYSILAPDQRGHGKSDGIFTTYGIKEAKDIETWMNWIRENYPNSKIILQGESMGATATMYVGGQNPADVKAIIEDCGYESYYAMYNSKVRKYLKFLTKPSAILANLIIKPIIGGDVFKSALRAMEESKIPTLFIHGAKDDLIPYQTAYDLYDIHQGPKKIHIAKGAGHAESKLYDADIYFKAIFDFLDKIEDTERYDK